MMSCGLNPVDKEALCKTLPWWESPHHCPPLFHGRARDLKAYCLLVYLTKTLVPRSLQLLPV